MVSVLGWPGWVSDNHTQSERAFASMGTGRRWKIVVRLHSVLNKPMAVSLRRCRSGVVPFAAANALRFG
jgi:hypothetical protein